MATCPPEGRYFVGMGCQRLNRLYGRPDLTHDEWLYGSFERAGAAAPRSGWLRAALTRGDVRLVIMPRGESRVPGLKEDLRALGFVPGVRSGDYRAWERRSEAAVVGRLWDAGRRPGPPGASAGEPSL